MKWMDKVKERGRTEKRLPKERTHERIDVRTYVSFVIISGKLMLSEVY
jgi:hypothetical protein